MRIAPRAVATLWDEVTHELVAECVGLELINTDGYSCRNGSYRENGPEVPKMPGCLPVEDGRHVHVMHSVDLSYKVMLWDEVKPVGAGYL